MGRVCVLGDVHGAHRALVQVLERANFDPAADRLIFLGDVCDGWPEVSACIKALREAGAECVWGNHDQWTWEWMVTGHAAPHWISQGGRATYDDFTTRASDEWRELRKAYFANLSDYIYDKDRDFIFVHGGIPRDRHVGTMPSRDYLMWDRDLFTAAAQAFVAGKEVGQFTRFKKCFIGHTTTERFSDVPVTVGGVVLLDQGGGWSGKLSLIDADTSEYWQSDVVADLYPECPGRRA